MAEKEEAVVEEKKSGNPLMLVLIVLVVILMAAIGGIGYMLFSKGFFDDKKEGEVTEKVEKKEEANKEGDFFTSEIKDLVLNVTTSKGREKLMKLSFSIKSVEPTIEVLVDANKPQIIDLVIQQVSSRSSEELLTAAGKELLKEELISEINVILNEATTENKEIQRNSVKQLFFTTFVIK